MKRSNRRSLEAEDFPEYYALADALKVECAGTENFRVDPKIAWAKLRALSEGADLASRRLWRR